MNNAAPPPVRPGNEREVTYYGLPSVKPSLWGGLVSGYMFVAGVGGSAALSRRIRIPLQPAIRSRRHDAAARLRRRPNSADAIPPPQIG